MSGSKLARRSGGRPNQRVLRDIVRRIVKVARPEQVILFGSGARGEMGPHSDLDLLVIKGGRFDRWRLTTAIQRELRGAGAPADVVIVTPEEAERYRDIPCTVVCPALREGKVVYGAQTLAPRRPARMAQPRSQQPGTRRPRPARRLP